MQIEILKLMFRNYPFESTVYIVLRVMLRIIGKRRRDKIIGQISDFVNKFPVINAVRTKRYTKLFTEDLIFCVNKKSTYNILYPYLLHEKKYASHILSMLIYLRPRTFIDVGAHLGEYSIRIAKKISNCKVYAFEPVDENVICLLKSVAINRLQNVIVVKAALLNYVGEVELFLDDLNTGGHSIFTIHPVKKYTLVRALRVPAKTLDSYGNFDQPLAIKIDVEGAESLVLEGALNILKQHDEVLLFIEVHSPTTSEDSKTGCDCKVCSLLRSIGYTVRVFEKSDKDHRIVSYKGKFRYPNLTTMQ